MGDVIRRGHPDWNPRPTQEFTGVQSSDLELASRLVWPLSPYIYGEVMFYDNFEAPTMHLVPEYTDSKTYAQFEPRYANSGCRSLALVILDGGAATMQVNRVTALPWAGAIGLGCYYAAEDDYGELRLQVYYRSGGRQPSAMVKVDLEAEEVSVYDSNGVYVKVADIDRGAWGVSDFCFVQVVADFQAEEYVRVVHGSGVYPVSYSLPSANADSAWDNLDVKVIAGKSTGHDVRILVDDVAITRSEYVPAA